mmetsp:Transcript_77063/g.202183  ORF Transcript_77063/g.202183 Transcript_77063/m.202183 type:complete len:212 (+) Transcript_77063:341-976(+)
MQADRLRARRRARRCRRTRRWPPRGGRRGSTPPQPSTSSASPPRRGCPPAVGAVAQTTGRPSPCGRAASRCAPPSCPAPASSSGSPRPSPASSTCRWTGRRRARPCPWQLRSGPQRMADPPRPSRVPWTTAPKGAAASASPPAAPSRGSPSRTPRPRGSPRGRGSARSRRPCGPPPPRPSCGRPCGRATARCCPAAPCCSRLGAVTARLAA